MFEVRRIGEASGPDEPAPYAGGVALSASDVAEVLRQRLPGLPVKKLHKLLYYCQGHHLAVFDEPLFAETISAWDMGPVVGTLWFREKKGDGPRGRAELDEAQLNTVGYVLSRYGALTGTDLEHLTHSESPWRTANQGRRPGEAARIEREWMQQYFRTAGAAADEQDDAVLESASVSRWLHGAEQRRCQTVRPDSPEELRARLTIRV